MHEVQLYKNVHSILVSLLMFDTVELTEAAQQTDTGISLLSLTFADFSNTVCMDVTI